MHQIPTIHLLFNGKTQMAPELWHRLLIRCCLIRQKTYNAVVSVLDETKSPVDDITKEIKEEAEAHQFFYTLSSNLSGRVSITRTDKDLNNLPVGLELQLSTTAGASVQGTIECGAKPLRWCTKNS
jgi:hypothetical protein